ncbi:MAG TPA: hypothetical protein VGM64_13920 [Lacunisphaera sp.]|jgi:hypothetical protein
MPNQIIAFNDQGVDVVLFDDGSTVVAGVQAGAWKTQNTAAKNNLCYSPADKSKPLRSVPMAYSLNRRNQLGFVIGDASSVTLNGRILLEGHSGILYQLVDDDGADVEGADGSAVCFFVYGYVSIDPAKNQLMILDSAGVATVVNGKSPGAGNSQCAVSVGPGDADPATAIVPDLISFNAVTLNTDSAGKDFSLSAELDLSGSWDLRDGKTVFTAKLDGGAGSTSITVGLVGQLKGVAVGFQFTETGNTANVLFTIHGRIKGENASGGWDFTLGYSGSHYSAKLAVKSAAPAGSNGFTINGSLEVAGGGDAPVTVDLALGVEYVFNGGALQLKVAGSGGVYSLAVSGQLKLSHDWTAEFAISYNSSAGLDSFSLQLGDAAPGSSLNKALGVFVSGTGSSISVGLTLDLAFVGGVIVPAATPVPTGDGKIKP